MAYRQTPKVRAQRARQRDHLLHEAEQLVREKGFAGLTMQALAERADVGVGTLYRQFTDKSELAAAVFSRATNREVDAVGAALQAPGDVSQRLANALRVFVQRAFAAPQLAWTLIAEPVAPEVEAERLHFRQSYQRLYCQLLEWGVANGDLPPQQCALSAAALVGAIAQALIEPLRGESPLSDADQASLISFCLRAVGAGERP